MPRSIENTVERAPEEIAEIEAKFAVTRWLDPKRTNWEKVGEERLLKTSHHMQPYEKWITCEEWCLREMRWLAAKGVQTVLKRATDGRIAIFRTPTAEDARTVRATIFPGRTRDCGGGAE